MQSLLATGRWLSSATRLVASRPVHAHGSHVHVRVDGRVARRDWPPADLSSRDARTRAHVHVRVVRVHAHVRTHAAVHVQACTPTCIYGSSFLVDGEMRQP